MVRRWQEEKKEKQWNEWMDAWDKCRRIRAFAAAVKATFEPVEPGSRIAEWLDWSAKYADRFDPLREGRARRMVGRS